MPIKAMKTKTPAVYIYMGLHVSKLVW